MQKLEEIEAPRFIFYDPFSTHTDVDCWSKESLQRLFNKVSHLKQVDGFTYTTSKWVRKNFEEAGFKIAPNAATGTRTETTRFYLGE